MSTPAPPPTFDPNAPIDIARDTTSGAVDSARDQASGWIEGLIADYGPITVMLVGGLAVAVLLWWLVKSRLIWLAVAVVVFVAFFIGPAWDYTLWIFEMIGWRTPPE
jgi:hypothetical protein